MIKKFNLFESVKDEIRKYAIILNNVHDAIEVTNILLFLGFETYSKTPEQVTISYRGSQYKFYEPYDENGYQMGAYTKYIRISIEKFRELTGNKKYKKIERPDIDPYGEDDWGFIQNESLNNS